MVYGNGRLISHLEKVAIFGGECFGLWQWPGLGDLRKSRS